MPLQTVHVKIRHRNQVLDRRDVSLDADDDAAVRAALLSTLKDLGVTPTRNHTISIYRGRAFIRKLHAA